MNHGPILYCGLGQIATIILHLKKDPQNPRIDRVLNPELKPILGFPLPMFKLIKEEDGIFAARFKLPHASSECGTYLCLVKWFDSDEQIEKREIYTIILEKNNKNQQTAGAIGV